MTFYQSKVTRQAISEEAFSVSARVAMQLGRESISSSLVALLELVKNTYDADAENVVIKFIGLDTDNPILTIQDDGNGMSKDQLTENWLVIGTDNKATQRDSRNKKRVLVGEKGLGRLGLDRLAQSTVVQTFTEDAELGLEIEIDWTKYESSGERLEDIKHQLYIIPKKVEDLESGELLNITKGTRLVLLGLRDIWQETDVKRLHDELALLISPFGGINDFSIILDTGMDWPNINGEIVSRQMLDAAEWTLISDLNNQGEIIHKLFSRNGVEFNFSEPWRDVIKSKDTSTNPLCGPIHFELYFFERDKAEEINLSRGQIRNFLVANQGIRIYRDQFRVKPYGDPSGEGDWLNLALRRVQNPKGVRQPGKWVVGYNQIVGAVFIERDRNQNLLDQTNREGIVEGPAYYDLRRYVLHAIEFFENQRQKYERSQENRRKIDEARKAAEDSSKAASKAIDDAKKQIEDDLGSLDEQLAVEAEAGGNVQGIRASVQDIFSRSIERLGEAEAVVAQLGEDQKELIKASEEQEQEYEEQKNTLGNLASLGILAAAFGHETLGETNKVIGNVLLLRHDIFDLFPALLNDEHHKVISDIEDIERATRRINSFAAFSLANVQRDKRSRSSMNLRIVANEVFKALNLKEVYNIDVELNFPSSLPNIRVFRIDWESIFVNFTTNAKWAIDNINDLTRERKIRLNARIEDGQYELSFADSGIGISETIIDRIFEPVFSTRTNEKGDVIGTGMGLAIVQSLVQSYDGTITVDSNSDLGGAEFHVKLPLDKISSNGK